MEKLLQILEKQQHTLNKLIGITKQEQAAIIAHNLDCVKSSLKQKEELENQLVELESQRQTLAEASKLKHLTATAGEKAAVLEARQHSLKNSLQELQSLNTTNRMLIKMELAYFDFLKEKIFPSTIHYNEKGSLDQKQHEDQTVISHLA